MSPPMPKFAANATTWPTPVERGHRRPGADVVVHDLDFGVALLERGEFRRPVGPCRAGVEAHYHAFLFRRFVERFLAGVELGRIEHGLRRRGDGEERYGKRCGDPDERA